MSTTVPAQMASTVTMLRRAFPNGIPDTDRVVLMAVMKDTGMSDRSIAFAFGHYSGTRYEDFLHEAATCAVHPLVTPDRKERIKEVLRPFGYDRWAQED